VTLQDILYKVSIRSVHGNTTIPVRDLQLDSRKAGAGSVFIAVKGSAVDGHRFIDQVLQQGAVAVICERRCGVCAGREQRRRRWLYGAQLLRAAV
jgi:UDP-N-acetylmuramoyl-L-alanyl-D-glutamate--2,6-diaminopimelate ligase